MAIFHLSIRPISRGKGHSAVAQIAYDTRSKLIDERTGQKHDWSKHHADVIESQIIGPAMTPGQLAVGAELAEKRYDSRVGRAMDVALPHELTTAEQWALLRGFALQLRDTYGCALSVSLHHPNRKGYDRNTHGHIFMTARAVDDVGHFSASKIRCLDDRRSGPLEIERIREMWETRCNRSLKKAGHLTSINRLSLQAQGIDRAATQHLGPQIAAMARNGCRMRKAEINQIILSDSRRLADINTQLQQLKNHAHRLPERPIQTVRQLAGTTRDLGAIPLPNRSASIRQTYGLAVRGKSRVSYGRTRLDRDHSATRFAHLHKARKLARFLARGTPISRLAQGHHFRRGQLLVGTLRALREIFRLVQSVEREHDIRHRVSFRL